MDNPDGELALKPPIEIYAEGMRIETFCWTLLFDLHIDLTKGTQKYPPGYQWRRVCCSCRVSEQAAILIYAADATETYWYVLSILNIQKQVSSGHSDKYTS